MARRCPQELDDGRLGGPRTGSSSTTAGLWLLLDERRGQVSQKNDPRPPYDAFAATHALKRELQAEPGPQR